MTILLYSDWKKHPNAVVHTSTKNVSFSQIAIQYQQAGIKNHAFMLSLLNPKLVDVDPFDPYLTDEQKVAVTIEARDNMWYYFRECVRVPSAANRETSMLEATRGNIAMWWAFGMRMTVALQQIRQTRKSFHANVLLSWLLNTATVNLLGVLTTKDERVGKSHLFQIAEIVEALPEFLQHETVVTINSRYDHEFATPQLSNDLRLMVPLIGERQAKNQGRGMTFPLLVADDLPYQINCQHSFSAMIPAMGAAVQRAHDANMPYGVIIPTTAGKRDTPEGEFVYQMFSGFAKWSDSFFDADSLSTLYNQIRNLSPAGRYAVWIEMNHRDLGLSDEWLRLRIEESRISGDDAERDYFNKWTGIPYQAPSDE